MMSNIQLSEADRIRHNGISSKILGAAIEVHKEMGPGLLESIYQHCLVLELLSLNLSVNTSVSIPLVYKGTRLDKGYCADILVEDLVIVELKSVEALLTVHKAQLVSYLKLADKRLGLLINFNVPKLKEGLHRFVHKF